MEINTQKFGDKEILADALTAEKAITGVYNTFTNECACPNLRNTMLQLLNEEHNLQAEVFTEMHSRGFYPTPMAETQKIDQAKQKYQPQTVFA